MSVMISDAHIGTTMWQLAILKSLGIEAFGSTLSSHIHYADPKLFIQKDIVCHLSSAEVGEIHAAFETDNDLRLVKCALCSFPPSRFLALSKLPEAIRIIINIGHRIHIHVQGTRLVEYTELFQTVKKNPRFKLATMSEYDYHYTRYYTGIDNILRLPVVCEHIPASIRHRNYNPKNRTVLIGPSHNTETLIGFKSINEINQKSKEVALMFGVEPYEFQFIKSLYPNSDATPCNLASHPAVLVYPYSAFSISMIELYQCNIPTFIPSDEMLLDKMNDVRLSPIYQKSEDVRLLDERYRNRGRDQGYDFSPNDDSPEAQIFWKKFMYFNQVKNVVRFNNNDDLFTKLYSSCLGSISREMMMENEALFARERGTWSSLIRDCI
jgi:hypothetical protein